jgi:hypothetical protein
MPAARLMQRTRHIGPALYGYRTPQRAQAGMQARRAPAVKTIVLEGKMQLRVAQGQVAGGADKMECRMPPATLAWARWAFDPYQRPRPRARHNRIA